jgi:hypothetical protein
MSSEDDFLDKPIDVVQEELLLLDAIKGLEALSTLTLTAVEARYPEFGVSEQELHAPPPREPLDSLHHFAREILRNARGARQQLEQRIFGKK